MAEENQIAPTQEDPADQSPRLSSGFTQQVYEATESAVGEGPQNQDDVNTYEATFSAGEGTMLMDETPPQDVNLSQDESEASIPEIPLQCEPRNKINGNLFTQRLRRIIQDPNTLRVIKGLIVVAIAMKLLNSMEVFDRYLPSMFGSH